MKWLIIAVVVIAVLLLVAVVVRSAQHKKKQVARERAGELRSEVATSSTEHQEQEALAREREAEAERARAQADRLQAQADRERTAVDQTRAHHEDRLREADRLDPDVDHRADDYSPTTRLGDQHDGGFDGGHDGPGHGATAHDGTTGQQGGFDTPRQGGDGTDRT
ncbi:MAG: hypothetical protein JWR20_2282 [Marmoricola sp.]|jgi:hypothetical protein|nr:hypothetical protein [Marmoricola sp.]